MMGDACEPLPSSHNLAVIDPCRCPGHKSGPFHFPVRALLPRDSEPVVSQAVSSKV